VSPVVELRSVHIQVPGQPPRKGNSRIIAKRSNGKYFLPKSKAAQAYEKIFKVYTWKQRNLYLGGKDRPLKVEGEVFYRDKWRADLSIELVLDCMVRAGIISDDRYVVWHDVRKRADKSNPRIDLWVREIEYEV